jgi:hypothetical protein
VRSAEGGEEVIERVFVSNVYSGKTEAPFVFVAAEQVVVTDRSVEKTAWRNPRRVLVVVLGVGSRNADKV